VLAPIGYVVAVVRIAIVLVVGLFYAAVVVPLNLLLVRVVSRVSLPYRTHSIQTPLPPLRRSISWILTSILSRLSLFLLGVWWISVEQVPRKRGYMSLCSLCYTKLTFSQTWCQAR
jgi:hypothetical protein